MTTAGLISAADAEQAKIDFNFTPPTPLFEYRYRRSSQPPSCTDVAADGRFLVIKQASVTQPPIEVITNWAQNVGRAK